MKQANMQPGTRGVERAKSEFYIHLAIYFAVGLLLSGINLTVSPGYAWVKWPLMGWGIGVAMHGFRVFTAARVQ